MIDRNKNNQIYLYLTVVWGALIPLTWLLREWHSCVHGICRVSGTPPEWDFTIFWQAGRLALARHFTQIADFQQFHQLILSNLHYDVGLSPFAYSPLAFLVFAPLGLLPLPVAYLIWLSAGFAALLAALRLIGLNWLSCGLVLASPACLYNILLGQNGAFTAALLICTIALGVKRPVQSGIYGACLFVKPQLALLLPFLWLSQRNVFAIAAAGATALALLVICVLSFGIAPWMLFFTQIMPMMHRVMTAPYPQAFQVNAITLFICLRALGMSVIFAQALQGFAVLAAGAAVIIIWQRPYSFEIRLSLTMMLTLLAMPYGYVYDMLGYTAALALIAQTQGISLAWALFWMWPAIERNVTLAIGLPMMPLIVLAAFIWLVRLESRSQVERPARPS